ncbi:MAG: hypothetical protein EOO00_03230 [Chitinophagaceae bacterium]|nr:MAG: hypothetical protein EOO00_03230 [Chitinophagaceae bacterium]
MRLFVYHIVTLLLLSAVLSCSYSKKFTETYYKDNEATLQSIRQRFKALHTKHAFSLELKDLQLQRIGIEIHTDSIKYIYNFNTDEPYLLDTLDKYNFDVKAMRELIDDMQLAHCPWITNLDYYEKREKKYMVFLSVRHKELNAFLRPEKYFTLAFFDEPQPVDEKGRLMDKEDLKKPRRINNSIFWKINDRVFYALSGQFR